VFNLSFCLVWPMFIVSSVVDPDPEPDRVGFASFCSGSESGSESK
jgi:hypothetical protein